MLLSTTLLGFLAALSLATDVCPECCTMIDGVVCSSSECAIATICTPSIPSSLATAVATETGSTTDTVAMNRAEAPHSSYLQAPTTDYDTTSSTSEFGDDYASSTSTIPVDYNPAPNSSTTSAAAYPSSSSSATSTRCPACCLQNDSPCASAICHIESICPCSLAPSLAKYQSTSTTAVAYLSSLTDYTTVTTTASVISSRSSIFDYEHNDLISPPVPTASTTEAVPYQSYTSPTRSILHDDHLPALWATAYNQFHFDAGEHDVERCHPRTGLWDGPHPTGRSHHCHDDGEESRDVAYPYNTATATSTLLRHAARDLSTTSPTGPTQSSPSTCPDCCYSDIQCDLSVCAELEICPRPKTNATSTLAHLSSSSASSLPSHSTSCPDCCYSSIQCGLSVCVDRAICPYPKPTTTSRASEVSSISSVSGAPSFTTHINFRRNVTSQVSATSSVSKPTACPSCCHAFAKCALSWCEDPDVCPAPTTSAKPQPTASCPSCCYEPAKCALSLCEDHNICPVISTISNLSVGPQPTTLSNVVVPRARNMVLR